MSGYIRAAVALLSLPPAVFAANALKIESTTAPAGQQDALVRVMVDNTDPVIALSFAGTHGDGLAFDRLTFEGTVFGPGNLEPDFFQEIKWGKVFGLAVVIELPGSLQDPYLQLKLTPGTDHYAAGLYFDIEPGLSTGTELKIDLRNDLESCDRTNSATCIEDPPVVDPVFTVDGATVVPELVDGTITIGAVEPPTITSVTPDSGSGDVAVTITGTNFTDSDDTTVLFGMAEATDVTVASPTQLTCHLPPCAGTNGWVSIRVATNAGAATRDQGYLCGAEPPELFRRGDSNRDGDVNIADAVYILQYLFARGPAVLCPDSADSNDDEDVNIADAVYILQFLFARGPDIPAPYPDCGADETGVPPGTEPLGPCDYCPEACEEPPTACP